MPVGWYIVPYVRDTRPGAPGPARYCEMDDYTAEIQGYGGWWTETEVLGNRAIVKVRARAAVLTALNALFTRLPKNLLDDSLADLSTAAKQKIKDELLDMGYTPAEILTHIPGDLGDYTLRDVLRFAARRRLKPRYDSGTDTFILDGVEQACRAIASVDAEVSA